MSFKITTLIENNADDNNILFNEHGLSLYIEIDEMKLLIDTGESGDFIKNAEKLKVNLNNLDYVLLSHGHYDHTGGFKRLVEKVGNPFKLIVGEKLFYDKYALVETENYRFVGNPFDKDYIEQNNIPIKYMKEDLFYINENIMVISNFEKNNDYEFVNKMFYIEKDGKYIPDNFPDEIALAIKTEKGLFVIVGCSHVGICNILETIVKRTGMPIYGVLGGTHLIEADETRIEKTINYFKEKDISILAFSHCTGEKATEKIKEKLGEKYLYNNTGNIIEINNG
ncbi:MBL fold metallo-hydrolase [Clostridium vincentii]|uniref:Putative hydrolase n=1 Tax=Clostridium vincentii TaxID=52704 RepID=A0A2T0B6G5_9CLOT|nr:MBL fold metallo-hydrolase [Clostridium vincentii]PRR79498.1 putative hydrolase [Clostridium vincentii]